jgi:hypothetical protein
VRPLTQFVDEPLQRQALGGHAVQVHDERLAVAVWQAFLERPRLDVEAVSGAEAVGQLLVHLVM